MKEKWRWVPFVVAALILAACAREAEVATLLAFGCVPDAAERVGTVDWATAETVEIKFADDRFQPLTTNLKRKRAYLLRVINEDDQPRFFSARKFLHSVAVASIAIGEREFAETCIDALGLPAQGTAEIRLVPVRQGSYDFADNRKSFSHFPLIGAHGYITIE